MVPHVSKVRLGACAVAISVLAAVGAFAAPAGAAWSSCPSTWNCFWSASSGAGNYSYGAAGNRPITSWGARSGYNHGGGSYRACGYANTYAGGGANYVRDPGTTKSFSYRTIRSMYWVPVGYSC